MKQLFTRIAQTTVLSLASTVALAGTISVTGADLLTEPGVSFPTQTPTQDGSSLVFGTGSSNPVLVRWDLIDAGALTAGSPATTFTLNGNVTRNSSDFDFSAGLWDGTNYAAVMPIADGTRSFGLLNATSNGVNNFENGFNEQGSYSVGIGESVDFELIWNLDLGSTDVTLNILGQSHSWSFAAFDRTADLSLLISKQSFGEQLQINSLSVESALIGGANPVPAGGALAPLMLSVLGLGLLGRKRPNAAA